MPRLAACAALCFLPTALGSTPPPPRAAMHRPGLALLLSVAAASAKCPAALTPGEHLRRVTVGGVERRFYVLVPHDMPQGPRPGVVMMHGCGSSPEKFELESLMNVAAERHHYYNVYPEGTTTRTSLGWNAGASGQCQTGGLVNDVDFVRAVVLDMVENLCLDEDRLFAAGFSNGGQMVYNLTCEMPQVFAAFSVTGMSQHHSTQPASCGLALDQVRPMVGICGSTDFACASSFTSWVRDYAGSSGCQDAPATEQVSSTTTKTSHARCGAGGAQPFDAYSISGLGHCWSGNDCCDGQCLDQSPANIDSSNIILSFFDSIAGKKHLRGVR